MGLSRALTRTAISFHSPWRRVRLGDVDTRRLGVVQLPPGRQRRRGRLLQVIAFDGVYTSAPATITVTVAPVNDAPTLTGIGNQWSVESDVVTLQLSASDPDSDLLTWSADGLPPALSIDAHSGLISGTVGDSAAGSIRCRSV